MYFNDSGDRVIRQFDYNIETGDISNEKIIVDLREKEFEGCESGAIECPDGCTIDGEGKYTFRH